MWQAIKQGIRAYKVERTREREQCSECKQWTGHTYACKSPKKDKDDIRTLIKNATTFFEVFTSVGLAYMEENRLIQQERNKREREERIANMKVDAN